MSLLGRFGDFLERRLEWYRLPTLLAIPKLIELRNRLRKENLHDTEEPPLNPNPDPNAVPAEIRNARTADGTYNDLNFPHMGCRGARLGRNIPVAHAHPDHANLLNPNPRTVSLELMTRNEFQPATSLNLLAASWIQFMNHDWFSHKLAPEEAVIEVPLDSGDTWPQHPMKIRKTLEDPAPPGSNRPPAYANDVTHWWDGSQIYGSDLETQAHFRFGQRGRLIIGGDHLLPLHPDTGIERTGFPTNWWIGLTMLHSLFTLEHNAICEMLLAKHPDWDDQKLFDVARLINCALMAKIHTIEWTPALLPHSTTKLALRVNWYGIGGEDLQEAFEFLDDSELLGGIVGSSADHHGAPFSLTEEFVSVYRMHQLMPDRFVFRSVQTGDEFGTFEFPEVFGRKARGIADQIPMPSLFYSFGISHPGAIRLHNFPRHLQKLTQEDGTVLDLAAIDVLRDRERGVPRYNAFRKFMHKDPVKDFEELTDNEQWREEIRRVYNNDIDMIDLQVGLVCEPLPEGFAFSETAFRVFVLMASRRLKSDRFLTDDFRPEVYTQEGLDWIDKNSMVTVLKRHFPELTPALEGVDNGFEPWKTVSG